MAEEEETKEEEATGAAEGEDTAAEEEEADSSFIQKLLSGPMLLVLVALLSIGIGVGVSYFIFGGKSEYELTPEEMAEYQELKMNQESASKSPPPAVDPVMEDAPQATDDEASTEEMVEEVMGIEEASESQLFYKFQPLVVNIFQKNSIHYLKLQMQAQVNNPAALEEIDLKLPKIRDQLLFIFSDRTLREVLTPGGKALLKEDILKMLRNYVKKGKVVKVYFTDFTIQ